MVNIIFNIIRRKKINYEIKKTHRVTIKAKFKLNVDIETNNQASVQGGAQGACPPPPRN